MHSDPIADMLTRIRNAMLVSKESVNIPGSKIKKEIARILKEEGYILGYEEFTTKSKKTAVFNNLKLMLKYIGNNNKPVIQGLKRVSRPGLRNYVGKKEIPRVLGGLGVAIMSTSQGIMTDNEARYRNTGGEVLCIVW